MPDPVPVPEMLKRSAPKVVAPSNRINVAFPLSKISVQEPSQELAELVAVVAELASMLEGIAPGPQSSALGERARALVARVR
jgi:hypothetical protein